MKAKDPREAAFLAGLASLKEEKYIIDSLEQWREEESPSSRDYNLAQQIAYGAVQRALSLDYIVEKLADREKLRLRPREKVLLRDAIYQHCFMDRIPMYALTNETMKLAKKYCNQGFVKFLNAILRKLSKEIPPFPEGMTVPEMSIRYSYPKFYVQELIENHSLEKAIEIMELGNLPSPTMFRIRGGAGLLEGSEMLLGISAPVGLINDFSVLKTVANSPDYYIQNATPAILIHTLANQATPPKRILDLCASPGGKLIAAYDCFPDAALFANDVSHAKLQPLSENCEKYGVQATLSALRGEEFTSDTPFDLIILDVPCSNSGVLNKRPEARWRLSEKSLQELEQTQRNLLEHALALLSEDGEIWYLTCSVLKQENNRFIEKICKELNLKARMMETVLPSPEGLDGGFAAALSKITE